MGKGEQVRAMFERVEDCHILLGILTRADALEALRVMEPPQALRILEALEKATEILAERVERLPTRTKRVFNVPQREGEDRHVDVHEAARIVGMSVKWLYRHSRALPFTRVTASGRLRFSAKAIQVWLQAHTERHEG